MAGFRKAPAAYAVALKLDPDNVDALSGHGTLLIAMSAIQKKPELIDQGMAEMSRAVELAPTSTTPRLNRAFSGVNLPPAKRDVATIVQDLTFLAQASTGSQAGDYIHLLLGDLYYETGKPDLARAQYQAAARPGAKAEAEARARLEGLAAADHPGGGHREGPRRHRNQLRDVPRRMTVAAMSATASGVLSFQALGFATGAAPVRHDGGAAVALEPAGRRGADPHLLLDLRPDLDGPQLRARGAHAGGDAGRRRRSCRSPRRWAGAPPAWAR